MSWLADVWARFWDPVAVGFGAVAMAVVAHLWRRIRDRMLTLRWSAHHQSIGVPGTDPTFGSIKVLHNGCPVHDLGLCYIEIENESTRDLTNLEFTISYADGTCFLMSVAALQEGEYLTFAQSYSEDVRKALALPTRPSTAPELQYLARTREYTVPVLNRRGKIDFAALVQPAAGRQPTVRLTCVHKGVRVRQKPPRQKLLGVDQNKAIGVGLLVALVAPLVLGLTGAADVWPMLIAFLAGAMVALIGVAVIHVVRLAVKLFS